MSHEQDVKNVYGNHGLFNARWYDKARYIWTKLVSEKAEKEFVRILRENIKEDTKILELGFGTGINIGRILDTNFKSYIGYDFTDDMINVAVKKYGKIRNVSLIKRDITKPLGDQKYDLVISTWVMSHLDEPSTVINDAIIHLNKDGILLFIFLTKPKWHINFWFQPILRFFACKYVSDKEIDKIKGDKIIKKYSFGMTTLLYLKRDKRV